MTMPEAELIKRLRKRFRLFESVCPDKELLTITKGTYGRECVEAIMSFNQFVKIITQALAK